MPPIRVVGPEPGPPLFVFVVRGADAPLVTVDLFTLGFSFFFGFLEIGQVVHVLLSTRRADAPLVNFWKERFVIVLIFLLCTLWVVRLLLALLLGTGFCGMVQLVLSQCACLILPTLVLYFLSFLPSLGHLRILKEIDLSAGVCINTPIL